MPKFSVIIPVYNVAPYLRACLDSVIAAIAEMEKVGGEKRWTKDDKPLVEVICVDDGSTDGSGEILDEYREKVEKVGGGGDEWNVMGKGSDPLPITCRFRVIHQKNAGVSAARNAALDVATGEWICFVDADDVVAKDYFYCLSAPLKCGEVFDVIAFGNVQYKDGYSPAFMPPIKSFRIVDCSRELVVSTAGFGLWNVAVRKAVIDGLRFKPYCLGEDLLFVTSILAKASQLVVLADSLYGYRERNGSAVRSPISISKIVDIMDYLRDRIEVYRNSGKKVDKSIYRRLGLAMTESVVGHIFDLPIKTDRREALSLWRKRLDWMAKCGNFTTWISFVVSICRHLPFMWTAILLCRLPHELKCKGIHR